ncbi:MAG: ATP-binding protein [Bacteroidota bacterium]
MNNGPFGSISKKYLLLLLTAFSLFIATAVLLYYFRERSDIRQQKHNELKAIAELKIRQITGWIENEKTNAGIIANDRDIADYLRFDPDKFTDARKTSLESHLEKIRHDYHYDNVGIILPSGKIVASTLPGITKTGMSKIITNNHPANKDTIVMSELYMIPEDSDKIYLDIIAPLKSARNNGIALVFRIDAKKTIFPLIDYWPVMTRSSETFVIRKEENSVLYLNNLRYQKNTALKFRLPMTRTDLPAVKAVSGYVGIFEGKDYRGIDVLAYLDRIPGTRCYMVAKIDKSELLEGLYFKTIVAIILASLLIIVTAVSLSYYYNHRQNQIYKLLFSKERELWQSQQQFKTTIDSLGEGVIITDLLSRIVYLNKFAEELTGWKLYEAEGKLLEEVYCVKDEETGEAKNNIIDQVLIEGNAKNLSNRAVLTARDGRAISVADIASPILDNDMRITGLVLTFMDETEKRNNNRQLQESESRFRSSLDTMMEGCQMMGFDWSYLYLNETAEKHNRKPNTELIGRKYADMWPGIEKTRVYGLIKDCLENRNSYTIENEFTFPDGQSGWFELKIQPIPEGVQILSNDITERKIIMNDLIEAKNKAEEINRIKSFFFANMSHELRTPFVGILGYAELLYDTITDTAAREMLRGLLMTSRRIKNTLTKILSLSELEFSQREYKKEKTDIREIIENVSREFEIQAMQKNLLLKTYTGNEPLVIETEATLLREILSNLISNAIIYTDRGKVEVLACKIVRDNKPAIQLRVADTGIGIPGNKQKIIWEDFRQASEGYTRSYQGTGLGLSIVKKCAEFLDGYLSLESREGEGSTFILELPLEQTGLEPAKIDRENRHRAVSAAALKEPRILYVEDDQMTVDVVNRSLSPHFDIEFASDAETVLNYVHQKQYNIIFMDINLGGRLNGTDLVRIIRGSTEYKDVPIIAVTAYASETDRQNLLAAGMSDYIAKPFMMKDLQDAIERLIIPGR